MGKSKRTAKGSPATPRNSARKQPATEPIEGKPHVRPNDALFFRRLEYVNGLLSEGRARADILSACEKRFGIAARTVDDYIARSRVRWEQEAALAAKDQRTATLQRIETLLARLERERAWAPLISALRLQVDVLGLMAPHRMIIEETPKSDSLNRMGLCEVVREMSAAMRGTVRAIHFGIAKAADPGERTEYVASLRALERSAADAIRVLRTGKLNTEFG